MMGSKRKKRWNGRRLLVMLLCALLLMPQLGAAGTAEAADKRNPESVKCGLYAVESWDGTSSPDESDRLESARPGGTPNDKNTVSKDDSLVLEYQFSLTPEDIAAIDKMEADDKNIAIAAPEGLVWKMAEKNLDIKAMIAGEEVKFATLHMGDSPSIEFIGNLADTLEEAETNEIEEAFFFLGCGLDDEKIGIPGGAEQYTFNLTDGTAITLNIKENLPKDSVLESKTGDYTEGKFTWTIKYTPGQKEKNLPLSLVDSFDSTYHNYVGGSFKVNEKGANEVENGDTLEEGEVKVTTEENRTTITYQIPRATEDNLRITYETALTDKGFAVQKETEVSNTAQLQDSRGNPIGKEQTAQETFEPVTWLDKVGTFVPRDIQKNEEAKIDWTVTITTNNKKLETLVLHDEMQSNEKGYLEIDKNTIKVKDHEKKEVSIESDAIKMTEKSDGFSLDFNPEGKELSSTYEVTYSTTISDDYFEAGESGNIENKAWLKFSWVGENGDSINPEPPTVTFPVGADGRLIKKEGVRYNPADHTLEWKITVNPQKLDLKDVVVTDELETLPAENAQTFVENSFVGSEADLSNLKPEFSEGNKTMTLDLGKLDKKSYTYTIKTTVDDPEVYAYNLPEEKAYSNTVSISAELNGSVDPPEILTGTDTASLPVTSQVVSKEGTGYNYETGIIDWKVVVNRNKMPMKEATLEDTLAKGLKYVEGSAKIGDLNADGSVSSEKDFDSGKVAYDQDNGMLTLTLDNAADNTTKAVTFQTKITDREEFFKEDNIDGVKIPNKIVLKRDSDKYDPQETQGVQNIPNQMMKKMGEYDEGEGAIAYEVNLNPNKLNLEKAVVKDQLPKGLQLDPETIELVKATVLEGDRMSPDSRVDITNKLKYSIAEGWFELELPEERESYILKYSADVIDPTKAPFKNQISMKGSFSNQGYGSAEETPLGGGGGGGGGAASKKIHLTVEKQDENRDDVKLQGAKFQLEEIKEDGTRDMINTVETDNEGKAVFKFLKKKRKYCLTEMTPPTGYLSEIGGPENISENIEGVTLDKNTVTFTTTDDTPKNFGFTLTNKPVTGTIQFTKANDLGAKPAGAEFSLTKEGESSAMTTATSDKDGKVTFENVPYGTYEIKETKAPANHEPSSETYTATITANGETVGLDGVSNNTVINTVKKGEPCDLHITKLDRQIKEPMQGVTFTYTDEAGKSVETGPTDEGGKLTVPDLKMGQTYNFKEKQPEGYKPWSGTVTMDQAEVEWIIYNDKEISGGLPEEEPVDYTMTVKDKETGEPVEGVTYNLWSKDKYPDWETALKNPPDQTKVSGKDGKVTFEDLLLGEYWIWEQSGPEGYEEEHTYLILTITKKDDGSKVFTLKDAGTGAAVDPDNVYLVPEEQEDPKDPTDPDNPQKPEGPEKPEKPGGAAGESHKEEAPNKSDKQPAGTGDKNSPAGSGGNETNIQSAQNKLPQTGQPWMQILLFAAAGAGLIAAGALLNRRQRQKK